MSDRIVIDVDRDGWTKGLQLNIAQIDENGSGCGYRLRGPKYNGSSKNLLRHVLGERDAAEIRKVLDAVFPPPPAEESRAAALREAADLIEAEQHRLDDEENAKHGYLDHESELQHTAVHAMGSLLRRTADAATPQTTPAGGTS